MEFSLSPTLQSFLINGPKWYNFNVTINSLYFLVILQTSPIPTARVLPNQPSHKVLWLESLKYFTPEAHPGPGQQPGAVRGAMGPSQAREERQRKMNHNCISSMNNHGQPWAVLSHILTILHQLMTQQPGQILAGTLFNTIFVAKRQNEFHKHSAEWMYHRELFQHILYFPENLCLVWATVTTGNHHMVMAKDSDYFYMAPMASSTTHRPRNDYFPGPNYLF